MAQITTTNRQAILELISQADETTEVAGLSASVTQLQIEVAGLSASVAGLTASAGTSGTSGTSGVNGTSGTSGNTGASGTSGTSGVSGTAGTSGTSVNGLNQFLSVDVPSGVATFSASASITNTVTDGTRTSNLHLDPNQVSSSTKFEIDDTTLQSGTGLVLNPDQSYQWGGDYNYSGITYSENYVSGQEQYLSTITDNKISQINLDPASLNTGTLFKSEDLSVGSSAILSLGYDGNSSFDMIDGVGGSSNLTFTPTTILMSATDGSTFTSTLEIDPLEAGNFTNLSTSDGTTVNKLQVSQGDAILSSAYGTTQSSVITQPTSINLSVNSGDYSSQFLLDPTGAVNSTLWEETNNLTTETSYIYLQTTQVEITSSGTASAVSLLVRPNTINTVGIPAFDDDASAGTGGLVAGDMYQTTGNGANPLDVAGILMIKQ